MIKTIPKSDILWHELQNMKVFSTVNIIQLGLEIKYISADRVVREWAQHGLVRRIPNDEIILRGLRKKDQANVAWYEIKT